MLWNLLQQCLDLRANKSLAHGSAHQHRADDPLAVDKECRWQTFDLIEGAADSSITIQQNGIRQFKFLDESLHIAQRILVREIHA
jgi:hypothetical protein